MVSRSEKVAGTMEQLLGGGEVYHYHTKLMMKEAHTGGSFVWHQDYGYIGVWVHTAWGGGGGGLLSVTRACSRISAMGKLR